MANESSSSVPPPPQISASSNGNGIAADGDGGGGGAAATNGVDYSMPGVLNYLQKEWRKYEWEKAQWSVTCSDLQERIKVLEGERRGQENVKNLLVRRIKMLEFALKQERLKQLPFSSSEAGVIGENGTTLPAACLVLDASNSDVPSPGAVTSKGLVDIEKRRSAFNASLGGGRRAVSILRKCVEEFEQTDDMISKMGGDFSVMASNYAVGANQDLAQSTEDVAMKNTISNARPDEKSKSTPTPQVEPSLPVSDAAASETTDDMADMFDFLDDGEPEKVSETPPSQSTSHVDSPIFPLKRAAEKPVAQLPLVPAEDVLDVDSASLNKMMRRFDIGKKKSGKTGGAVSKGSAGLRNLFQPEPSTAMDEDNSSSMSGLALEQNLLGDLAGITVANANNKDADVENTGTPDLNGDSPTWKYRHNLRSHFNGVRALAFDQKDLLLLSGGEDCSIKLWDLRHVSAPAKKKVSDVTPIANFRGHTAAVTSIIFASRLGRIFSASIDSSIRVWTLPQLLPISNPYGSYDKTVKEATYVGHTNAVWDLSLHPTLNLVASASADGTVKIWKIGQPSPLSVNIAHPNGTETPTSCCFVQTQLDSIAISFSSAKLALFDIETGKLTLNFPSDKYSDGTPATQINKVISHTTLPLLVTAHENHHIGFFDASSGCCIHSMIAHVDAVTSLDFDPSGLFLLSSGHDSSIRLWDVNSHACIQEIPSHRQKHDESILSVSFHPSAPFFASGGADSFIRVYSTLP